MGTTVMETGRRLMATPIIFQGTACASDGSSNCHVEQSGRLIERAPTLYEFLDGRVFVRVECDESPAAVRWLIVEQTSPAPAPDPAVGDLLRRARLRGHDFLLAVEQLRDGKVEYRGVNGQWPITAVTWLLVGLGIPVGRIP